MGHLQSDGNLISNLTNDSLISSCSGHYRVLYITPEFCENAVDGILRDLNDKVGMLKYNVIASLLKSYAC